jgi:hypothetical protein
MARHPTLDDLESKPDGPQTRRPRPRDNRDPATVRKEGLMGSGNCWCDNAPWADAWHAGQDTGPHPRDPGRLR